MLHLSKQDSFFGGNFTRLPQNHVTHLYNPYIYTRIKVHESEDVNGFVQIRTVIYGKLPFTVFSFFELFRVYAISV